MLLSALACAAAASAAQPEEVDIDTLKAHALQDVQVVSTRASKNTPMAFKDISKEEIRSVNFGKDIPYLMSLTPSVTITSDAGNGIGYTSLRVRGTDPTRINVTANGIPLNDAESSTTFWVNNNDLVSSVQSMQIQRGVGTSTNGAGAFGATLNMQTENIGMKPFVGLDLSGGSYYSHKETLRFGTGLINDHFGIQGRLSDIGTKGYLDRASAKLNSYFLQAGYFGENTMVKFITWNSTEETYHAWNYTSKEEQRQFGRRYNSCGVYYDKDGKMCYYDNQTDNYHLQNYQLLWDQIINRNWNLNVALHYSKGQGYYEEYKTGRTWAEYNLTDDWNMEGDLVRQKKMDNDFYGAIASLNYTGKALTATLGGGWNKYDGDHFGKVLWVKNYIGNLDPDKDYYRNNATKNDGNLYLKANYELCSGVNAYADLQYRHISYKMYGQNDKWNSVTNDGLQQLAIHEKFDFFNPKAGLSWQINRNNRVYGSFSVAHKEPTRNNYTDGKFTEHPKAERLFDYELGYTFANSWLTFGANLYYMDYKDQLVLTGELNEIGEAVAANVPDSYRMGIELMAGLKLPCGFQWDINATLSRNRVENFTETLYENEDPTGDTWSTYLGDTHIAFSPDFLLNNRFGYIYKSFEASLQSQYVSKQYMSNLNCKDHILDAYFVSNLNLSYTFALPKIKSITIGCTIYNLFNEEYENNGYAGSGFYYEDGQKVRYNYAGYAAQAGTNVLGHISLRF